MKLENILAISGLPGLHKLVTTRSNGLVVEDFDSGKRSFVSLRKHQFTPLESVAIYTYTDVEELKKIFANIELVRAENPLPNTSSSAADFHSFFRIVLPDYDEDRVYLSDIKKVLKWYDFMEQRGMLVASSDEEE